MVISARTKLLPGESELAPLLAEPSSSGWREACLVLDAHPEYAPAAARLLSSWPASARNSVERRPLEHWTRETHGPLIRMCVLVHETHAYSYFAAEICNHPALCWDVPGPWGSAGAHQVHLARRETGAVRPLRGKGIRRIGEVGQGDLGGWLSVAFPFGLVAVTLECELKKPEGRLEKSQRDRRETLGREGGVYVVFRSVAEAAREICAARDRLLAAARR